MVDEYAFSHCLLNLPLAQIEHYEAFEHAFYYKYLPVSFADFE